jgi:hypothetical protein
MAGRLPGASALGKCAHVRHEARQSINTSVAKLQRDKRKAASGAASLGGRQRIRLRQDPLGSLPRP